MVMFLSTLGATGCAAILGIDDGVARDDAGPADATVEAAAKEGGADTSTTPDTAVPLACGNAVCNSLVQACCRTPKTEADAAITYDLACSKATDCADAGQVAVTCDRGATCAALGKPGTVCCVRLPMNQITFDCEPASSCVDAGRIMCPGTGDDEECMGGTTCQPSQTTIVGFDLCR
jgi:hypothetical protein